MDPKYYFDRMEKIPKYMVFSSNDEFMMSDWPNGYIDKIPGETHLYVVPNTDHSLATGFFNIIGSVGAFIRSVNRDNSPGKRPTFDYHLDESDGEISIKIPKN